MSFTSLMLLDRIVEDYVEKLGLDKLKLINIHLTDDGLKLSQEDAFVDGRISFNPDSDYPSDVQEIHRLIEIVVDNKNKNGFNLKIIS